MSSQKTETVKVAVRCRPLNSKERSAGEVSIVDVDTRLKQIRVGKQGGEGPSENHSFTFDHVYPPETIQQDLYDETARPIVDSVITGFNGTIFAYGQTGTGKTHTMEGVMDDAQLRGVMPNSFVHIMSAVANTAENVKFLVRVQYLEIYCEDVFDLLSGEERKKLNVREDPEKGVYVDGLSFYAMNSADDMLKALRRGQRARKVGATDMNPGSSRSHSIFTIIIETSETDPASGETHFRKGKLNLVDLAGSERQKKTGAQGERLTEAKSINQSLSALGNVIKALVNPKATHIPFRDSKLTRLLQDSLGGNTKTVMIANLGPAATNLDETMSTLRYANRAKNIKNKPKINEDPKDAMLRECQEEIERLRQALAHRSGIPLNLVGGPGGPGLSLMPGGEPEVEENIIERVVEKHTGIDESELLSVEERTRLEIEQTRESLQQEKSGLLKDKEEKERLAQKAAEELKRKHEALEKEKAELKAIQDKLAEREKQLMHGGKALEDAQAQKSQLKEMEERLRAQREHEEKLKKELADAEEAELMMNEQYKDHSEELKQTNKKLKKLWSRYQEKKQEVTDMQEEWELEREDLVDTIRELDRALKLKHLVLDAFIPGHYLDTIETRAIFDEHNDQWIIPGVELASNNIRRELLGEEDESPTHDDGKGFGGVGFRRREHNINYYYSRFGLATQKQNMRGGFDPRRQEMDPEVAEALRRALDNDAPRAPKDMYYTYGVDPNQEQEAAVGGRRARYRKQGNEMTNL